MSCPLTVPPIPTTHIEVERRSACSLVRLVSEDGTNRLTRACVRALTETLDSLSGAGRPLIITGNGHFFSAGADLTEIHALDGPSAYEFARMGQTLMRALEQFPAPVCAAIHGYCMGGGLDLALVCHRRVASPHAVFGHRGAALGLMTGWGGTQRLPRIVGRAGALEIFVSAEKIRAPQALAMGLVDAIAEDPVVHALRRIENAPAVP
ncbi:MAG TPA: enoyl-CoA hydratase/isomerase family protein [Terriglobales bacterium]|nr:enoyl-CoA hydratase/isomerase family protein [Terriglobales bacterium]